MKWEYLTVDKTLDNHQMNELGDAGLGISCGRFTSAFRLSLFLQEKSSAAVATLKGLKRLRRLAL